jgi:hypothetical protein
MECLITEWRKHQGYAFPFEGNVRVRNIEPWALDPLTFQREARRFEGVGEIDFHRALASIAAAQVFLRIKKIKDLADARPLVPSGPLVCAA